MNVQLVAKYSQCWGVEWTARSVIWNRSVKIRSYFDVGSWLRARCEISWHDLLFILFFHRRTKQKDAWPCRAMRSSPFWIVYWVRARPSDPEMEAMKMKTKGVLRADVFGRWKNSLRVYWMDRLNAIRRPPPPPPPPLRQHICISSASIQTNLLILLLF